jgi:hypothetical protein
MAFLRYIVWETLAADPNAEPFTLQHLTWEWQAPALCGFTPAEGAHPIHMMQPLCRECERVWKKMH